MLPRLAFVIACWLAVAPPAFAHRMTVKVMVGETEVHVTIGYEGADVHDGGGATVTLERADPKETVGVTQVGPGGLCSFPRPPAGRYQVVARDEFGHRAVYPLTIEDGKTTEEGNDALKPDTLRATVWGFGIIGLLYLAGRRFLRKRRATG